MPDLYVTLRVVKSKKLKSKQLGNGANACWNEEFIMYGLFHFGGPSPYKMILSNRPVTEEEHSNRGYLKATLFSKEGIHDEALGHTKIPLSRSVGNVNRSYNWCLMVFDSCSLYDQQAFEAWYPIHKKKSDTKVCLSSHPSLQSDQHYSLLESQVCGRTSYVGALFVPPNPIVE